jgi:CheY-like chemotaxis protein
MAIDDSDHWLDRNFRNGRPFEQAVPIGSDATITSSGTPLHEAIRRIASPRNLHMVVSRLFSCYNLSAPYGGETMILTDRKQASRVEGTIISVVDDDASLRTVRLLTSMGFVTHAFASAQEYLLSPRLHDTTCLIADVQMPGMSGVKLQEHLIAHGHTTPMIFITAFPEARTRQQTLNAGAIGFLSKPVDESRLLECVEQALMK